MTKFFEDEKKMYDREINRPDEWFEGFGLLSFMTAAEYYNRNLHYVATHVYHESGELLHVIRCDDSAADDFGTYYYTMHI